MNFERKFQVFWEFFMHKNGYNVVVEGLKNTLIIAVMGLFIGIVLGTLLATARVVPKTNVFVKIVEKCPDYQFLWFGSSSIKSMLPKKIQKIIDNPPKNLVFPGYVDKDILIGAFGAAKTFLFMTYEENEGIVVLEALSSKLPLVVRDIPVYDNWLSDGKNCFKAKDNEEFYKKMVSIVNEKVTNIDEIIQNAYDIALERDLVKIGEKYKKYYEDILK